MTEKIRAIPYFSSGQYRHRRKLAEVTAPLCAYLARRRWPGAAAALIERLGDGYDTVVGNRCVNLSDGQRQRLAIARVITPSRNCISLTRRQAHWTVSPGVSSSYR